MSAHTDDTHTTQTTLTDASKEEIVRQRAELRILEGKGLRAPESRFLSVCPPDTEIDELPELWEVYKEAVGGVEQ